MVEAEIKEIKDDGIKIGVQDDQEVLAQCSKHKIGMIDGNLSGLAVLSAQCAAKASQSAKTQTSSRMDS